MEKVTPIRFQDINFIKYIDYILLMQFLKITHLPQKCNFYVHYGTPNFWS